MQPPVDYPVADDVTAVPLDGPITYAALLDRHASRQPVTEDMIHSACLSMETAQQLPFAARPVPVGDGESRRSRPEVVLSRLLKVIRLTH